MPSAHDSASQTSQEKIVKYTAKCHCNDPKCNVDEIARAATGLEGKDKKLGYEINGLIMGLSIIKEASHAAGTFGGPMRVVCGVALTVVQNIATMGDSNDLFTILGKAVIQHSIVLVDVYNRMTAKGKDLTPQFKLRLQTFEVLLKDLSQFIAKMQKRGRFSRFILANADLMTLKKLRHQMEDTVSSFQTFLMTDIYCGENKVDGAPTTQQGPGELVSPSQVVSLPPIHVQVKEIMAEEMRRRLREEKAEAQQTVTVNESGTRVNVNAPLISLAGAGSVSNATFYRSGTVATYNYENMGNDHSTNNYTIANLSL